MDWSAESEATRRTLAAAVRELVAATLLTTADDDAMGEALAQVRHATAGLAAARRASRYEDRSGLVAGMGANDPIWETHALYGGSNPLAPPMVVEDEEPGRLVGSITYGDAYEGGPGAVYGGNVAAAFDGALGRTLIGAGHLVVTRSLLVRYLRPTPLHTPLRVEAVVGQVSGRNVECSARMSADDVVTAEADGVFTIVEPQRYER